MKKQKHKFNYRNPFNLLWIIPTFFLFSFFNSFIAIFISTYSCFMACKYWMLNNREDKIRIVKRHNKIIKMIEFFEYTK